MPVSGLVVQIDPACRETLIETLAAIEHVEIPAAPAAERLVVVLDVPTMRDEEEIFKQISDLPGVRNVTLSYHNFEDISASTSH